MSTSFIQAEKYVFSQLSQHTRISLTPQKIESTWSACYQLLGYAATTTAVSPPLNILIFRGTVTVSEVTASVSLTDASGGWTSTTPALLPTNNRSPTPITYGNVKSSFWSWYTQDTTTTEFGYKYTYTSLAENVAAAASAVQNASGPGTQWVFSGHSLGGGLVTLAALDLVVAGVVSKQKDMLGVTFGSVVVGDSGFAKECRVRFGDVVRVANECDAVPSIRSLAPGVKVPGYVVSKYVPSRSMTARRAGWTNGSTACWVAVSVCLADG